MTYPMWPDIIVGLLVAASFAYCAGWLVGRHSAAPSASSEEKP